MTGFVATFQLDVRRQARSGLYAIGVLVAVLFGLIGRFVFPAQYAGQVLSVIFLLSLSSTTYVFCAAQVLMDRSEATLLALRTSPLTASAYMVSKVTTLTLFSMAEGAIIYVIGFWGAPVALLPLMAGVVCLGLLYSLIGLGQVARHTSVLSFLLPGVAIVGSVSQLPVLYVLGVGPPAAYYAIPSMGPLLIMLASVETLTVGQWAYAIIMTGGAIVLAAAWAHRSFRRHVRLSGSS